MGGRDGEETRDVVLAVHGGAGGVAGGLDDDVEAALRDGIAAALEAGRAALDGGGSALDGVEAAVVAMEDAEIFNAGRGAVYTSDATQELEAAVMDGATRDAGAAILLRHVRNPVRLARAVMERTDHVTLSGPAAELFARDQGLEIVPASWFHSDRRLRALLESDPDAAAGHGTVGAVALDREGRLAAATSTGGTTGKHPGRVGDTPTIGAGTYADGHVAVSATGVGEYFVRVVAGHRLAALVADVGLGVGEAGDRVLREVTGLGGSGGLIALDADGRLAMPFSTAMMSRGYLDRDGRVRVAVTAEEEPG